MFDELEYMDGKKYEFQEGGRNISRKEDEKACYEAVIGSTVARRTGLKVGDTFQPVHGDALGHREQHDFEVVGILKPTGTPNDRAIFVNIEGFYRLHKGEAAGVGGGHEKGEELAGGASAGKFHESHDVTAALVLFRTPNMPRRVAIPKEINRDRELQLQAVAPAEEVTKLFEGIVGNIQWILLFLAILIVIVAGIGILVSIYNSMSDRRHEIAIMRALGARRVTVMMIVLCESILLALGGGAIGVLMGHGLTGLLAPVIAQQTGVIVSPLQFQTTELVLIPGLILLATVVGYLPAVVAYRTDVAQSLIASP
jgi:putative ABC transport system permease protein